MDLVRFNLRVYGILINEKKEVLLVDEEEFGMQFTKFPGGGLELGEGLADCLKREWMEELGQQIEVERHFYTTDFFIRSGFDPRQQLISIYYLVKPLEELKIKISTIPFDFTEFNSSGEKLSFRWLPLSILTEDMLTFPVDKLVAQKLLMQLK
jgi:ADP-ribose pyrophosphatase YjhB (NUDIX family)